MRTQLQLICIRFGIQNGCVPKCEHREINLLLLIHRDSGGKRNLPEALAKVNIH